MVRQDDAKTGVSAERFSRRGLIGTIGGIAALGVAGCSAPTGNDTTTSSNSEGTTVSVTLADYSIDLSMATIPAGPVTFDIENDAGQVHEFVVFSTDRKEGNLPTTNDGNKVDEEDSSLTLVDEVEDIEGGASATLDVDLDAGHYVAVCNISAHYELGMHAGFTVE